MDWKLLNIILVGFSFMLLFTAFQTSSMMEESVIEGAVKQSNGTFKGNGYTSLATIYAVFAVANWGAPSIVALIGPTFSMLAGGFTYCLFIASFLKPMTWAFYTCSALVGLGAAIIWTGQGNFQTINSDETTVGRNGGIFWALLQCSLLFGNLYVYFQFRGVININNNERNKLYGVLTGTALVGLGIMVVIIILNIILKRKRILGNSLDGEVELITSPKQAFIDSFKLFKTKDMVLLCLTFAYTGFELTFFSGVYGTAVGHNKHFGSDAKSLIGLCGIFIGVGEIFGGGLFGILSTLTRRYGRDPIVLFGYICHMIAFFLIFLNQPFQSPITDSDGSTFIKPNKILAIFCAFLLGLGDSSFNTQIYSILGSLYSEKSAPAFALFKFSQSLTAAAGFFYSNVIQLQWQLLILIITGTIGTVTFLKVEQTSVNRTGSYNLLKENEDTGNADG